MFKKLMLVGLALFATACVPIPGEPPATSESLQTTEQLADCPGGYLDMLPGQSANDPTLSSLPAYIDIVRVDSSLDGDTLTSIFFLRDIPEEMPFNREGVEDLNLEYMWTVEIKIEGDTTVTSDRADFTLVAFYAAKREVAETPATVLPLRSAVKTAVWKNKHYPEKNETHWLELPVLASLIVSHEDSTLTLIGRVPGITDRSTISFSTFDILLGQDGVSCRPG